MDLGNPLRKPPSPSELKLRREQAVVRGAYLCEGGDEAGDADEPRVGEEPRHLGDAPDVLLAVLRREAQVLVQAVPDVVAVQGVARDAMSHQVLFQSKANGRLASSRKAWRRQESEGSGVRSRE